jgi:hypothetical protein
LVAFSGVLTAAQMQTPASPAAVCPGRVYCWQLYSGIYKSRFPSATKLLGYRAADYSSYRHALAIKSKEKAGCEDQQRRAEGGCCPELDVRVFGVDRMGWIALECGGQNLVG